jgi:Dyp-type peroxidase family
MAQPVTPTKSRSVLGATELTLLAPLKRGLIPALDTRSFQSRANLVLTTVQALGISRREIDPTPAIAEVADSIRAIRSFRMAILGSEQRQAQPQVLLSVSFDGGWEPYMRRIWRPLGPLLDLIFCNCEGYLLSTEHGFPAYAAWVRQAQVETGLYYEASALTVADWRTLAAEKTAPALPARPPASPQALYEQARPALLALYRLSEMFPDQADNAEAHIPRAAAQLLLGELKEHIGPPEPPLPAGAVLLPAEQAAWRWFCKPLPARDDGDPDDGFKPDNVQGGILEPHADLQQGRLLLVGLDDAAAVGALITHLEPVVSVAAPPYRRAGPLFVNLAFTYPGLVLAGVDRGTLDQLSPEFREGMAARAGVLGDWQHNHPTKWTLPERRGPGGPVELSEVHVLITYWLADGNPRLIDAAQAQLEAALGSRGRVLAVQPMRRITDDHSRAIKGHFGFVDGISQPPMNLPGQPQTADGEPLGELLLGYRNARGDKPLRGRLWTDSTYLVVRKLQQDVKAFLDLGLTDEAKAKLMGRDTEGVNVVNRRPGNDFNYTEDPDGSQCPLFAHIRRAHPRTPRPPELDHLPRIMRRGMSYGPRVEDDPAADRGLVFMAYNASIAEQFEVVQGWLAGRNSPGEGSFSGLRDPFLGVAREGDPRRFEWVDGQGQRQATVLPAERPLVKLQWGLYAFVPSLPALRELATWARERALEDLVQDPEKPKATDDANAVQRRLDARNREQARQAAIGSELISRLNQVEKTLGFEAAVEHWKIALEDLGARMRGHSQAVWTAIRKAHNGVLRTPYGVLVCSPEHVQQVFDNTQGSYSVSGYNTRLAKSFGEIFLGRDYTLAADPEARGVTQAVMKVTLEEAFDLTFARTADRLDAWAARAGADSHAVELRDLVDEVLAEVCTVWFGLPDETHVLRGGWHWREDDGLATCPGHFHSPSRYTFQPRPGERARATGEAHGKRLKERLLAFIAQARQGAADKGTLGRELFAVFEHDHDAVKNRERDKQLAATIIGVMMGFLPTVDGNLRGVLYEWVLDRSLWDLQARWHRSSTAGLRQRAQALIDPPLIEAMQLRPVPEVVWRTVLRTDTIGPLEVRAGDTVVLSIVSAMQEDRLYGRTDRRFMVFGGGDRREPQHPTHACPGYAMAMGVMLGFLAALLDTVSLRPGASPMALRIGPLASRSSASR